MQFQLHKLSTFTTVLTWRMWKKQEVPPSAPSSADLKSDPYTETPTHKYLKLYFKLYLFYNSNTRQQIGRRMILLGGELIRNIFGQGKPLKFLPWIQNPILLMSAMGFEPMTSQSISGGCNT